ncbi:phosphatase PAP2 family protein [Mesorhizobium sp. ORM16]|uniref:phosphatase PAP2 family protein n=1 Tax=Mesorhizobium sp. ORM16 TaxID=3376989 RepID=UPI003857B21C
MSGHTGTQGGDLRSVSTVDLGVATTRSSWLLTGLCLVCVATALCLRPERYLLLSIKYFGTFLGLLPVLLVVGLGLTALVYGGPRPTRFMVHILKERGPAAARVVLLFFLGIIAFTTFRITIPEIVPYYADPMLADLDRWLHGVDPWVWTHGIVSEPASMLVFKAYMSWWFMQWLGVVLFVAFWNSPARRIRYLWAFALTMMLCGTVLPIMLSSSGPIFYDRFYGGSRFAGVLAALMADPYALPVRFAASYLLDAHDSGSSALGSGITAMPSMHVAIVTLNAFFLTGFGRRWAVAGWSFAALILFGSVYTGWHYAVDGYLSILVVSLLWYLTGRFVLRASGQQATDVAQQTSDTGLAAPNPAPR